MTSGVENQAVSATAVPAAEKMDFQLFRQRFQLHIHTAFAGLIACLLIIYQLSFAIDGSDLAFQNAVKYLNAQNSYLQKWFSLCFAFFLIICIAGAQYFVQFKKEKNNSYRNMHASSIVYIVLFVFLIGYMIFLTSGFSSPLLAIYAMMFALLMENGNFDRNGKVGAWLRFSVFLLYTSVIWLADYNFHRHFDAVSQKYIKDNIVSGWLIHTSMATASLLVPFLSNWITSFFASEDRVSADVSSASVRSAS